MSRRLQVSSVGILLQSLWCAALVDGAEAEPLFRFEGIEHKWGYIDGRGRIVIGAQFEYAGPFLDDHAWVAGPEGDLLIDRMGRTVYACAAQEHGGWFAPGTATLKRDGHPVKLLHASTGKVTPTKLDDLAMLSEGLAAYGVGGKWGYVSEDLAIVVPAQFEDAMMFKEGKAAVKTEGRWGYIDPAGIVVVKPSFELVTAFHEGFAVVQTVGAHGKVSYIDTTGALQFHGRQFAQASNFSEGRALVQDAATGLFGYIDATGKYVIEPRFRKAASFSGGMAAAWERQKAGFINQEGEFVLEVPRLRTTTGFHDQIAFVHLEGGSSGYIDRSGKRIFWRPAK